MKEYYQGSEIEILSTYDVQENKDFVEVRINNEDAINFIKKNGILVLEIFGKHEKAFEIPLNILEKAVSMAKDSIED